MNKMGDLVSDSYAAIGLIIEEYSKLKNHDPNNNLLKYLSDVMDNGFVYSCDEKIRQEFVDKYAPDDKTPIAVMFTKYLVDLKNAVDKIEGINRSLKKDDKVKANSIKKLDDLDLENDPPF
jgi:hypothetical protein